MPKPETSSEKIARGAALKAVRLKQGLTQMDVALRLDMKEGSYAQIEQGRVAISGVKIAGVAQALGVPEQELRQALDAAAGKGEPLFYEVYAHRERGRALSETAGIDLSDFRDHLAVRMAPEPADVLAEIVQGIIALKAQDQAFVLEAIVDLLAGRRARKKRRARS